MNIRKLLRSIWRRKPQPSSAPAPSLPAHMRTMLAAVAQTKEQELSCDEVYALLDVVVDRVRSGEEVVTLLPLIYHHLQMCPECHEEYAALLRAIEAT